MCLFSIKILKTYCPNLTSTPPCPASITMEYSGFGEDAWMTKQAPMTEKSKITAVKTNNIVRFFMVINLGFIKIFYLLIKKL